MTNGIDFGCVVVGGGVVGAAIAARLARTLAPVLVVERRSGPGQVTSSRNSGVVHAGLHYPADWLKTTLCIEGRRHLEALNDAGRLPMIRCGKLMVAVADDEIPALDGIRERAAANGIEGLTMLDGAAATAMEPRIQCVAALHVPCSSVVDPHAVTDHFVARAEAAGATFLYRASLARGRAVPGGIEVTIVEPDGSLSTCRAATLVNAAGLDADAVARSLGIDVDAAGYRQHRARGEYWRLGPRWIGAVARLVYPVPSPQLAGLGIHLTVEAEGGARLGPDVTWQEGQDDNLTVDGGGRARFHRAARRYLPSLQESDLSPDTAGIRPKIAGPGDPPRDFLITEESGRGLPGVVTLLGIESPGLTAAWGIGNRVADLLSAP